MFLNDVRCSWDSAEWICETGSNRLISAFQHLSKWLVMLYIVGRATVGLLFKICPTLSYH